MEQENKYYLEKNGRYFLQNFLGYTPFIRTAGIFDVQEAKRVVDNYQGLVKAIPIDIDDHNYIINSHIIDLEREIEKFKQKLL